MLVVLFILLYQLNFIFFKVYLSIFGTLIHLEQMQLEESSTDGEEPILPPPPEGNGGD
jgi:hypothetical protein